LGTKKSVRSVEVLKAENRVLRQAYNSQAWASVIVSFFKYATLSLFGLFGYLSIDSLAGKTTFAQVVISFLGQMAVSKSLAYIFGFGGILFGVYQRRLRKKTAAHYYPRVKELEKLIDPRRSSSDLTIYGETNPRDKE
jgi:hypothetical protein